MSQVVRECMDTFHAVAAAQGAQYKCSIMPDAPALVRVDVVHVQEIVRNLIGVGFETQLRAGSPRAMG